MGTHVIILTDWMTRYLVRILLIDNYLKDKIGIKKYSNLENSDYIINKEFIQNNL